MRKVKPIKIFAHVWIWFVALLLLCVSGFWASYFGRLFQAAHFTHHLHAIVMMAWVVLLIGQAWLASTGRFALHRWSGRASYVLAPMVVLSGIIVAFHTIGVRGPVGSGGLWFGLFSSFLFGLLYVLAIKNRRQLGLHARYMIATGLVFVVPAFGRLYFNQLINLGFPEPSGPWAIQLVPALLGIALVLWDWRYDRVRLPFVLFTGLWVMHFGIWLFVLPNWQGWQSFATWMAGLKLFS